MTSVTSYFTPFSGVSIVDFEQVNVSWVTAALSKVSHVLLNIFIARVYTKLISR